MKPTAEQILERIGYSLQEYEKHRHSLKEITPENRTLRLQDTAAITALQELQLWLLEKLLRGSMEKIESTENIEPSPEMPDFNNSAVKTGIKDQIRQATERWPFYDPTNPEPQPLSNPGLPIQPLEISIPKSIENLLDHAQAVKTAIENQTLYNPLTINALMQEITNNTAKHVDRINQQHSNTGEASEAGNQLSLRDLFAQHDQTPQELRKPQPLEINSRLHPHIWPNYDFTSEPETNGKQYRNSVITIIRVNENGVYYLIPYRFIYNSPSLRSSTAGGYLAQVQHAISQLYKTIDKMPQHNKHKDLNQED